MEQYKKDFIEFLVRSNALKFGDFTLKSGRKCPYFLNMGSFNKGSQIGELGKYYAEALDKNVAEFDTVFGPAYKGIPLCVAATAQMFKLFGKDVGYSYNRKEVKDHGEGGSIIGAPINAESKVVIVDDVMTAGTALRESFELMKALGGPQIKGVLIAIDRMERGQGEKSAAQEVKEQFGIDVYSIVNLDDIIEVLYNKPVDGVVVIDEEKMAAIKAYRAEYGV
jgi:orotate phosphoribosyltransferase